MLFFARRLSLIQLANGFDKKGDDIEKTHVTAVKRSTNLYSKEHNM